MRGYVSACDWLTKRCKHFTLAVAQLYDRAVRSGGKAMSGHVVNYTARYVMAVGISGSLSALGY